MFLLITLWFSEKLNVSPMQNICNNSLKQKIPWAKPTDARRKAYIVLKIALIENQLYRSKNKILFKNALTFSKMKNFGFTSFVIFIDSTTKEFRDNSWFFLWFATDIPWQGGVATITSGSEILCSVCHFLISAKSLDMYRFQTKK